VVSNTKRAMNRMRWEGRRGFDGTRQNTRDRPDRILGCLKPTLLGLIVTTNPKALNQPVQTVGVATKRSAAAVVSSTIAAFAAWHRQDWKPPH